MIAPLDPAPEPPPDPPPDVVRRQMRELLKRCYPQATWTALARYAGPALGVVLGVLTGLAAHTVLPGVGVAIVASAALVLVAWAWLIDPHKRAAWEVAADHQGRELAEWRRSYGAGPPLTMAAQRRWLAEHPFANGRAGVLLQMGRLADADAVMDSLVITSQAEWFDVANLRVTRQLFAGRTPDLEWLRAVWASLEDPVVRRDRRACVAAIESMVVGRAGGDAWGAFAAAHAEVRPVARSARVDGMVLNAALLTLLAAVTVAVVVTVVG